jgi:hypothetical protein
MDGDQRCGNIRLTYGLTPLKLSSPEEKRRQVAEVQCARIGELPVDALVVYDLQDESSRTDVARPFPYLQSIDPLEYAYDYLSKLSLPKIIYRSVAAQSEASLTEWMSGVRPDDSLVLVGAPSRAQEHRLKLKDGYELHRKHFSHLHLGGVLIPERHQKGWDEDQRVLRKMDRGCAFFVTQAVYSVDASKDILSDLYFRCQREERAFPEIYLTLSPCGSIKTLEFLDWLGVFVPRWLRNELVASADILERSVELSVAAFAELSYFAQEKGIALGCNIESVSLHKAEIDASVELVHRLRALIS